MRGSQRAVGCGWAVALAGDFQVRRDLIEEVLVAIDQFDLEFLPRAAARTAEQPLSKHTGTMLTNNVSAERARCDNAGLLVTAAR